MLNAFCSCLSIDLHADRLLLVSNERGGEARDGRRGVLAQVERRDRLTTHGAVGASGDAVGERLTASLDDGVALTLDAAYNVADLLSLCQDGCRVPAFELDEQLRDSCEVRADLTCRQLGLRSTFLLPHSPYPTPGSTLCR